MLINSVLQIGKQAVIGLNISLYQNIKYYFLACAFKALSAFRSPICWRHIA
jgi:hypothetical protein